MDILDDDGDEDCQAASSSVPPKISAGLFCWSLAAILLSLQLVKWSHSGLTKAWSRSANTFHWPVVITEIFKIFLLVFTVMLPYFTQEPGVLTLCGFVIVFAYTAARVFIFYFVHRKYEIDELAENFSDTIRTIVNPLNLVNENVARTVIDTVNPSSLGNGRVANDPVKTTGDTLHHQNPSVAVNSAKCETKKRALESHLARKASLKLELQQVEMSIKNLQLDVED